MTFDTRLRSLYPKNKTSHIEALYRSLIRFDKSTWFMTSEASFAWKPHDCFSIWFKQSEPQRSFLYIIMRLHCFIFILNYILGSNELCPWNNSLRTETELTLTDHRCNSWVFVWFIWIILVAAVHRHKWMTLTMAIMFIQYIKTRNQ